MSTQIYYNGIDIVGTQPVPMFGLSNSMIHHGSRHAQSSSVTLDGQITGSTHVGMLNSLSGLVANFSENFKDLKVVEDGNDILTFSNCKVESISFSESTLSQLTDYSISLTCYNNFSGAAGILEPSQKVSFSENDDGTINLTHDISAKGIKTGDDYNNALENAKNYVLGLTGWNPVTSVAPHFLNGGNNAYPILLSTTETIDRFNASYSISENYVFSTGVSTYTPIVNYSVSKETNLEDDVTTVSVEANAKAGKNLTVNWGTFATSLNLYAVATGWAQTTDLLTQPIEYSIDENGYDNTLSIRASYDNNKLFTGSNVYSESSFSFKTDDLTNITTVSVTSNFFSRGSWSDQKTNINSYISSLEARTDGVVGFLHSEAAAIYTNIYGSTFGLSKHCESFSKSINDFTHEYSLTAEFTDTDTFPTTSPYYSSYNKANYNLSATPSITRYSANPSYNQNGYYLIYDMGVRPNEKISFSVNAVANTPAVSSNPADMNLEGQNAIIEKLANTWLRSYAPTFLDSESSNINEHTRNTSATQSYTQPSSAYVTNQVLIDHSYKAVNVI